MNIAIVGSSGYIAGYLLKRLENESLIKSILKIDKSDSADIYIDLEKPDEFNYSALDNIDFIIFTAAISRPDICATDFDLCWNVNVTGTSYFIKKAMTIGCKVLFLSSDAVFGDISGMIYNEESETKAETPYGRMKKAVEDEFKSNPNFKVIRLSYVVSVEDRFISYCLSCIRNCEIANVFHPFYRNVIVISDVVNVIVWFIEHWDEYKPFVLNVAGKELVSRIRMADELNRHLGNRLEYIVSSPGEDFYSNRPKITQMKSLYMQEYNILEDNTFTEKIRKELAENKL